MTQETHRTILTGFGKPIAASEFITRHLALFDDGAVYIAREAQEHPEISGFLKEQREKGTSIRDITYLDSVAEIRKLYVEDMNKNLPPAPPAPPASNAPPAANASPSANASPASNAFNGAMPSHHAGGGASVSGAGVSGAEPSRQNHADNIPLPKQGSRIRTGLYGKVPISSFLSRNMALFDDGTLYVTEGQEQHPEVLAFLESEAGKGFPVKQTISVRTQEAIRAIYAHSLKMLKEEADPSIRGAPATFRSPMPSTFAEPPQTGSPPAASPQAGSPQAASPQARHNAPNGMDGNLFARPQTQTQTPTTPAPGVNGIQPPQSSPSPMTSAPADSAPAASASLFAKSGSLQNTPEESAENFEARLMRHELITGPERQIKTSPFLTNSLALFEDGTLYIVTGRENHPEVISFVEGHRRMGTKITRIARIEYHRLLKIYEVKGDNVAKEKVAGAKTDKQREFLEIVSQAAEMRASDIHMTLWPTLTTVEYRVDGVIEKIAEVSHQDGRALMIAAFNMADTSGISHQMHTYQEARISSMAAALRPGLQALRLQFNPLVFRGRILVVRLLYSETGEQLSSLNDLGWSKEHQKAMAIARYKTTGVTIVSGPTGSGKTTTLKVLLEKLKEEGGLAGSKERHILTVEDPPEYVIDEVHQMPVSETETAEDRAREFTKAINAAFRSDPDTIVIGEVRDKESARLAFSAAMSGHQVWTTLHANSASSSIPRLTDIGVEGYKIADPENIGVLVAQRLPRKLCEACRLPLAAALSGEQEISPSYARFDVRDIAFRFQKAGVGPDGIFVASKGCEKCRNGYTGRTVIGEVIRPDIRFLHLASEGKMVEAEKYWLEELKGIPYQVHAIEKLQAGTIDFVELQRWCSDFQSSIDLFERIGGAARFFPVASQERQEDETPYMPAQQAPQTMGSQTETPREPWMTQET